MIKKIFFLWIILLTVFGYGQGKINTDSIKKVDTIVYQKDINIIERRNFDKDLNEKYSGKDFKYTEQAPKKKSNSSPISSGILNFLVYFMQTIFPFLLGGFVLYLILKFVLGIDLKFWKKSKSNTKLSEKLIYEDDNINEIDLDTLLKNALATNDFRLAIRYYYLISLKKLSNQKLIDYHKDKTNDEYLFEIENTSLRTQFSYLSYIYNYVWYGKFAVEENSFKIAEKKYQSFIKAIV